MPASTRKQPVKTPRNQQEHEADVSTLEIKRLIRSIDKVHETTDRKLQEIAAFCMDKKCNE